MGRRVRGEVGVESEMEGGGEFQVMWKVGVESEKRCR